MEADQRCQYCHKLIPVQNFNIHEARCGRQMNRNIQQSQQSYPELVQQYSQQQSQQQQSQQIGDNEDDYVICPSCQSRLTLMELDNHMQICRDPLEECPVCKEYYPRSIMRQHRDQAHREQISNPIDDSQQLSNQSIARRVSNRNRQQSNRQSQSQSQNSNPITQIISQLIRNREVNMNEGVNMNQGMVRINHQDGSTSEVYRQGQNVKVVRTRRIPDQQRVSFNLMARPDGSSIRIDQTNGSERVELKTTIEIMIRNVRNNIQNSHINEREILESLGIDIHDDSQIDSSQIDSSQIDSYIDSSESRSEQRSMHSFLDHMRLNIANLEDLLNHLGSRNRSMNEESINIFPTSKFKASHELNEEQKKCTVCFTDFDDGDDIKFLFCMHVFHPECIDPWLKKNSTCPICKVDQKQQIEQIRNNSSNIQ